MRRHYNFYLILGALLALALFSSSAAKAAPLTPEESGYSLSANPAAIEQGGLVTITWTRPEGTSNAFIAIYDPDGELVDFVGTPSGGSSGSLTRQVPSEPGGYLVRWVSTDNGHTLVEEFFQTTVVIVHFDVPGYSLVADPVLVEPGGELHVSWTKPANAGYGFIGIYNSDENRPGDGSGSHLQFAYPDQASGNSGVVTFFNVPDESGGYFLAWVSADDGGYKKIIPFAIGGEGGEGPPEEDDDTAPTVSITAPADEATLSGTAVTVSADADDNVGVAGVQFQLDGLDLGNEVTSAPYSMIWNTMSASNGSHSLTALARDAAGNQTTSTAITVHLNNTAPGPRVNVAAAVNGGVASASSTFNAGYPPSGTINGDRRGTAWGSGGGWNDGTGSAFPDWLQVDFAGAQTINEVDVFTVQDAFASPAEPVLGLTFSQYGITAFQVQYWDGFSWQIVPGGNITGNNQVWRQIAFSALTTTKIRVYVTGALNTFSRLTEVEAYSDSTGGGVLPGSLAKSSPANAATAQPVSPTLSWGTSSGATSYEYCVDTINNSSCDTSWTSTAGTSAVVSGLNSGTTYFWQVRARNSAGTTDADTGAWWNFTTLFGGRVNVAAAINGATASASSSVNDGYAPGAAINGDRKGTNWGNGGGWNDGTANVFPDWLQVDFAGPQTITEVDVFTLQDAFASPAEPVLGMPFTLYGVTGFQVQYWNGLAFVDVPGGNVSGNNQVWRQITFAALTTTRIRVFVTGALNTYTRLTEVEAYADLSVLPGSLGKSSPANASTGVSLVPTLNWGASTGATSYEYCLDTINNNACDTAWTSTPGTSTIVSGLNAGTYFWQVRARNGTGSTDADSGAWWSFTTGSSINNPAANVASAANGATATSSGFFNASFAPSGANDGDHKGLGWGSGGGWNDASSNLYPDWLQIDFAGAKTIREIEVYTLQDNFAAPVEPTPALTFSLYGITNFQVQYWDGSNWVDVPAGSISGNTLVWRRVAFPALTTTKIRINVTGALTTYSRITEVEAY